MYVPVKDGSGKLYIPSSFSFSADELSYFKLKVPFLKKYNLLSLDVANSTRVTVSNKEAEVDMGNTDERSDPHSETSQCGYKK